MAGRNIPATLLPSLEARVGTRTEILKIRARDGRVFGMANLDQAYPYDDGSGDGEVVYSARTGLQLTTVSGSSDLEINDAEATSLVPTWDAPLPVDEIAAGMLDYSEFWLYLVDFLHPDRGHVEIHAGEIGRVTVNDALQVDFELRGLSSYYREESLCSLTSTTCRHGFGSPLVDANGRMGCGVDAEALWVEGTVTALSAEPDRILTVALDGAPAYELDLGLVEMEDGANAGTQLEIAEAEDLGGNVFRLTLNREARQVFEVDQALRLRPDCPKTKAACIARGNLINMGAEPHINPGDAGKSAMPGARIGNGFVSEGISASQDVE